MKKIIFLTFTLLIFSPITINAENICENINKKTILASASTWDNLRNKPGSLRFETTEILKCGLSNLKSEQILKISTVPNKFKNTNEDKNYCETKYKETSKNPLLFNAGIFNSTENLNKWIELFSKGEGSHGEELYEKCDKSCSPQYTYLINKVAETEMKLTAKVICGLTRDKNENNYLINTTID